MSEKAVNKDTETSLRTVKTDAETGSMDMGLSQRDAANQLLRMKGPESLVHTMDYTRER